MKFNIKAFAVGSAIFWGFAVFIVMLANLACPNYGQSFLEMMASIYPGYHVNHSAIQVVIGTLYATADGLIGGAIFSWLYNWLAKTA